MMKNIYSFFFTTFHTCFLAPVPTGNHMVNDHSYNDNFRPKSSFILTSPPPYPAPLYWKRYIYTIEKFEQNTKIKGWKR
jgi:hypothetical protein